MDALKKILGVVWILLALGIIYYLGGFAQEQLAKHTDEGKVFGIIILGVLLPIIVGGLGLFGYYSLSGDYSSDKL
ncbi:MAG: hypothetical protein KBA06_00140 [Saprospiraceae bacterium]|nr:hypothetical protein [Saprospiraceae bacterium]